MRGHRGAIAWITAACATVACTRTPTGMDGFPLTSSVLAALSDARPYQLRLDDAQRHLECEPPDTMPVIPAATCVAPSPDVVRRLAALAPRIGEAVRSQPSADALWAAALLDLASGTPDGRQLDRAISRLREVRARDTTFALPANHLAVAHVARASLRGDARDLFAALNEVEQAGERDTTSLAIRFNRAAIHSLLKTHRHARRGFEEYQALERDGAWRAEGAGRATALTSARPAAAFAVSVEGIRRDPQTAREFVLDSLLPAWGGRVLNGDTAGAHVALERVNLIGKELLSYRGDSSVVHIGRDLAEGARERVAEGVVRLVDGTHHYRATAFGPARGLISDGVQRLTANGARALADWASLMLGATQMAERRHDAALVTLGGVRTRAAARGDHALEARALWASAIAVGRAGAVDKAEQWFGEAQTVFARINEGRNAAFMNALIADAQQLTGRSREAANSAFQAYSATARAGGTVRYEDLLIVAQQLGETGRYRAAAHLLREAALAAAEGNRAKDLPETLGRLALVQVSLGRPEAATETLASARAAAGNVTDAVMRSRLDAELHRAEARVIAASHPLAAIAFLDSSRSYFATNPVEHAALLLTRARLGLQVGDSLRAERDLADATRTIRALAPTAPPADARQLVGTLRDAHRTLIELALARGDTSRAFEETVSLPSLGARAPGGRANSAGPVGSRRAEVRFVVMPRRVLSWVRTETTRSLAEAAVSREELSSVVSRFINLVRSGDDSAQVRLLGARLYGSLLGGHESRLEGVTGIDVYTDGVLADLPLAVLTGEDGRLVVERFAIRYVVPAGSLLNPGGKVASGGPLLIGNPAWSRSDHPGMEPLKWADEEVRKIAELYPRHTVLSGAGASKQALIEAMPRHEVIHFAGHSRIVVENPGASHMVLAAGKTFGDGVIYASEISKLDLRGVKLVVLSSCGRTREDATSMGAVNGLAMAFLDAGVEAVVAGLWEVEDEGVGVIMRRAHEGVSSGGAHAVALRDAQVGALADWRDRGSAKAAFLMYVAAGTPAT